MLKTSYMFMHTLHAELTARMLIIRNIIKHHGAKLRKSALPLRNSSLCVRSASSISALFPAASLRSWDIFSLLNKKKITSNITKRPKNKYPPDCALELEDALVPPEQHARAASTCEWRVLSAAAHPITPPRVALVTV